MICQSISKEYNCFYLTKENIEEFIKWIKQYKAIFDYNIDDYSVNVFTYNADHFTDSIIFKYNNWYVYRNYGFYGYSIEEFKNEYYFPDITL